MESREKTVFDALYSRRSIRSYEERPVEHEKLVKLLQAGMAAPSACNLQVWEFVVVTDSELLSRLKVSISEGGYNAPVAVIVCANTANVPWKGEDWRVECSAAVENMMIAAVAMDLGSVWLGSHDETAVRELLDIPDHIHVMNVVYFGYPAEEKAPCTKYTEDAVYWQKYYPRRRRQLRTMGQKYESF